MKKADDSEINYNLSISKIVASYFLGILVFFITTAILSFLIAIILGGMYSIPILRILVKAFFILRKDGPYLFTICTAQFLASMITKHVVILLNRNNIFQTNRALYGIGVTLIVLGFIFLICNFFAGESVIANIVMIIVGFFYRSTYKR